MVKGTGSKIIGMPRRRFRHLFDNIGRYIIRNYRVSTDNNTKSNIFTTGVHIIADKVTNLQTRTELKPIFWKTFSDENEKHGEMGKIMTENVHVFRTLRYKFLSELLCLAMAEGNEVEARIKESEEVNKRICSNHDCRTTYAGLKYKCNKCGEHVVKQVEDLGGNNRRHNVNNQKTYNLPQISIELRGNKNDTCMVEPVFCNPNLYGNVDSVLDHLKSVLGISITREWSFIGCDGPPFCLASRLRQGNPEKYDWEGFIAGIGHLNMNQNKTLMKVLENIIIEPLAKDVLHFESPKAFEYFMKCTDTHKTEQALHIFIMGTAMEMMQLYLCNSKPPYNVDNFMHFSPSNTYCLIWNLVFNYALAIVIQKIGDLTQ